MASSSPLSEPLSSPPPHPPGNLDPENSSSKTPSQRLEQLVAPGHQCLVDSTGPGKNRARLGGRRARGRAERWEGP